MQKAWLIIKNNDGMSVVEALLAATVFGLLVISIGGAIIYSQASSGAAGDRNRANFLADEGIEAVRNIRDNSFSSLADGTYGLTQTGNQWALNGASDTNGIFTRQITIASNGTERKTVTSNVSWANGPVNRQVSVVSQVTNWLTALVKSWTKPVVRGSADASSTNDGLKVATQGNFAYLVRNDGTPDFLIYNISTPTAPTLVGSLSLNGAPTNIAVSGNYAYVTTTADTAELQIINIATPSTPSLTASFDAAGTADATGVAVAGNYAYITRKANGANNEFVAINISIPTLPTRVGWYNLNIAMNEVYVNGSNVFIVTDSDTQEIIEISSALLGLITVVTSINLPGTANATTIAGFGNTLTVGQGTTLYTVDGGVANSVLGSTTLSGTVNDIAINTTQTYAFVGASATAAEFQVVSISSLASPSVVGTADIPGTASTLNGVAYNSTLDVVPGASASDTQELIMFGPN